MRVQLSPGSWPHARRISCISSPGGGCGGRGGGSASGPGRRMRRAGGVGGRA